MTIAREVAEQVARAAAKANAKSVVSIELEIGDLAFLDPDNMRMWVGQALVGGPGEGASITVNAVASTLSCADCGFAGPPEIPEYHDHHLPLPPPACPRCHSRNVRLDAKSDCILKRIELETPDGPYG